MGSLNTPNEDIPDHLLQLPGYAAKVVSSMLLKIKLQNKDSSLVKLIDECYESAVGQETYVNDCISNETELQAWICKETDSDALAGSFSAMLSGHVAGCTVKMLAEMAGAKTILEIGTYTGYGAVTLAESSFCEELVTLEVDPYYTSFFESRLAGTPLEKKVRVVLGPAAESLVELKAEGKKFDFVFIDADKKSYLSYYKYIMDNGLLNPNGVIVCDNILWAGRTFNQADANGSALHEMVKYVKADERVNQVIIPVRDGMLLVKLKH